MLNENSHRVNQNENPIEYDKLFTILPIETRRNGLTPRITTDRNRLNMNRMATVDRQGTSKIREKKSYRISPINLVTQNSVYSSSTYNDGFKKLSSKIRSLPSEDRSDRTPFTKYYEKVSNSREKIAFEHLLTKYESDLNKRLLEEASLESNDVLSAKEIIKRMKIKPPKPLEIPPSLERIMMDYNKAKSIPHEEKYKFLKITKLTDIEHSIRYKDNFPLLGLRKSVWKFIAIIRKMCLKIIKSQFFEYLTLMIIIWNSVMLGFYEPSGTATYPSEIDNIFLGYYTVEMFLKMFGFGLIFETGAYLKDAWNIMDLVIIITAYIPILIGGNGVNLRGLRSLRVLRPLRTISTIKSLRVIVGTVLQTLPYMRDIIFIAFFSFFVYAIVGLQLFMGVTKNRCIDLNTGIPIYNPNYPENNHQQYCGAWKCAPDLGQPGMNLACAKMLSEPYYGVTSFGTILWSLLNVFQIVTQEGWSQTMIILQISWNPFAAIYFISCTFIGAYYFMNLIMAVITTIFEVNSKEVLEKDKHKKKRITREETLLELLDIHKPRLMELIHQYNNGAVRFNKIQFIRGKPYFYDRRNPRLKKKVVDTSKSTWKYFIDKFLGRETIPNHKPQFAKIVEDVKLVKKPQQQLQQPNYLSNRSSKMVIFHVNQLNDDDNNNKPMNTIVANGGTGNSNRSHASKRLEDRTKLYKQPSEENELVLSIKRERDLEPFDTIKSGLLLNNGTKNNSNTKNPSQFYQKVLTNNFNENKKSSPPTKILKFHNVNKQLSHRIGRQVTPARRNKKTKTVQLPKERFKFMAEKVNNTLDHAEHPHGMEFQDENYKKYDRVSYKMSLRRSPNSNDLEENKMYYSPEHKKSNHSQFKLMAQKASLKIPQNKSSFKQKDENSNHNFNDDIYSQEFRLSPPRHPYLKKQTRQDIVNATPHIVSSSIIKKRFLEEKSKTTNISRKAISKESAKWAITMKEHKDAIIDCANTLKDPLIEEDELIKEYLEDDLENIQNMKDRIIVDIRDLKISVNYNKIISKTSSLDEVIPSYTEKDLKKQEEKVEKTRYKAKLWPIYRLGEGQKKDSKPDYENIRAIYQLPIRTFPMKAMLYEKDLIFFKKANLTSLNTQNKRIPTYDSRGRRYSFKDIGQPQLINYKMSKGNRRLLGHGEPNIDLNYGLARSKIDDEFSIDTREILDSQAIEYFHIEKEYASLKQEDLAHKGIKSRNWSAHEILVLPNSYIVLSINKIKDSLMQRYESIWEPGYFGLLQAVRRRVKKFCYSELFLKLMLFTVIVNTIFLASVGILPEDNNTVIGLNRANQAFTILFMVEMGLKLIGEGPINYLEDPMNILDCIVVLISIVEIVFEADARAFKALRAIRMLRATRVLRVTKLLRALAFMRFLVNVLAKAFKDFMSVLFLMVIFSYIYSLLGMQLLGGLFNYPDNVGWSATRNNFDTLSQALISVFQIMTTENWNNILFFAERSSAGYYLPFLYLISWIIIGNYILLNLLMAMLLAQFDNDEVDEEKQELQELANLDDKDEEGDNLQTKETVQNPKIHFSMNNNKLTDNPARGSISQTSFGPTVNLAKMGTLMIKEKLIEEKNFHEQGFFQMYHENECEKSLYIFKKNWWIRKKIYKLIKNKWFDHVVLVMIIISSIKLAFDTYLDSTMMVWIEITEKIDMIITGFFFAEAMLKIISLGFIINKGCYLRDSWNILDFMIVLVGMLDILLLDFNLPFLKVFRLLRILRPLRLVTQNKGMRLMVTALLKSAHSIMNVGVVFVMIILIFAILGVNLFRNRLGICDVSGNPNLSRYEVNYETCLWIGYNWKTWDVNWDNVFRGMLSLFILSTQEGWPDYMFKCADASDADIGPIENNNLITFLYFATFLLVGSYFLVNLFVGVIMYQYVQAEKEEKKKYSFLTQEQEKWIELQKLILNVKPIVIVNPTNFYQKFWYTVIETNTFEILIVISIITNTFIMGLDYDESSVNYNLELKTINYIFTAIFTFEMFAKVSALGVKIYFKYDWNKFDFIVVFTSICDILLANFNIISLKIFRIAPQLVRVFRIFRATRLVRYSKHFLNIQKLITTIIYSIPAITNIFALVLLVFYIYATLATFLFSEIISGDQIGIYMNFYTFSNSIITLFICSTGENWYVVMFDTVHPRECVYGGTNCAPNQAICWIFWISFIIIVRYIILNLFIMVILDLFSNIMINEDNPLHHFTQNVENFKKVWEKFSKQNYGLYIHQNKILHFFLNLEEPLGFKKKNESEAAKNSIQLIAKDIMKMHIRLEKNKTISFHEILFASFRRAYGVRNKKLKGDDFMQKIEEKSLRKIDLLNNSLALKNTYYSGAKRAPKNLFNPLFQHLFMAMSFRAWKSYSYQVLHGDFHETSSSPEDDEENFDDDDEDDDDDDDDEVDNGDDDGVQEEEEDFEDEDDNFDENDNEFNNVNFVIPEDMEYQKMQRNKKENSSNNNEPSNNNSVMSNINSGISNNNDKASSDKNNNRQSDNKPENDINVNKPKSDSEDISNADEKIIHYQDTVHEKTLEEIEILIHPEKKKKIENVCYSKYNSGSDNEIYIEDNEHACAVLSIPIHRRLTKANLDTKSGQEDESKFIG